MPESSLGARKRICFAHGFMILPSFVRFAFEFVNNSASFSCLLFAIITDAFAARLCARVHACEYPNACLFNRPAHICHCDSGWHDQKVFVRLNLGNADRLQRPGDTAELLGGPESLA